MHFQYGSMSPHAVDVEIDVVVAGSSRDSAKYAFGKWAVHGNERAQNETCLKCGATSAET